MRDFRLHFNLLLKRLFLLLLWFEMSRLAFYFLNFKYFDFLEVEQFINVLGLGALYDISIIALFNFPFVFLHFFPNSISNSWRFQRNLKYLFFVVNSLLILFNFIDSEYFKFTLKRSSYDIFVLISYGNDFFNLLPRFIADFWHILAIWLVLSLSVFALYPPFNQPLINSYSLYFMKYKNPLSPRTKKLIIRLKYFNVLLNVMIIIISISTTLFFAFKFKLPKEILAKRIKTNNLALALNTPYTLFNTFDSNIESFDNQINDSIASAFFNKKLNLKNDSSKFRNYNVVIIVLESFSKEYIGSLNGEKQSFTPFFDKLTEQSYSFSNAYASGKKTIEAIPAIISSLPALSDVPFIAQRKIDIKVSSLATYLKKKNYTTLFFHGGTNGTMGFDEYAQQSDFDKYKGRNEFNDDTYFDGYWGIYDDAFFEYCADELTKTKMPFMACLLSLSSHHPYAIPKKYVAEFSKNDESDFLRSVRYADYSLQRFFEKAAQTAWYDSTLFVITADHASGWFSDYYKTRRGMYAVPLLFFSPADRKLQGVNSNVCSHCDIMPSVLDYLHFNDEFETFGSSIFTEKKAFPVNYLNGVYQLITKEFSYLSNGNEIFARFSAADSLMNFNLIADSLPSAYNENFLKSYIFSYEKMFSKK